MSVWLYISKCTVSLLTVDTGSGAKDAAVVAEVVRPSGNLGWVRSKRWSVSVAVRVSGSANSEVDASSDGCTVVRSGSGGANEERKKGRASQFCDTRCSGRTWIVDVRKVDGLSEGTTSGSHDAKDSRERCARIGEEKVVIQDVMWCQTLSALRLVILGQAISQSHPSSFLYDKFNSSRPIGILRHQPESYFELHVIVCRSYIAKKN